jgi:16S rRNA (guanine527-N7)-methyltransferase
LRWCRVADCHEPPVMRAAPGAGGSDRIPQGGVEGSVDVDDSPPALRARVEEDVKATLRRSATQGFLGSMPVDDQIDHALGFVAAAEAALGGPPKSAVDLGTGGGVPGLVLHSCWPACHLVLVDGNERRTDFLSVEVAGWPNGSVMVVVRGRAEELGRKDRYRGNFELVTARSFGRPAVVVECGAPLLGPGGVVVVSEPPHEEVEARWPEEGLAEVGLTRLSRTRFDGRFGYQVLLKSGETPDRYPRRVGVPTKRPLF